MKKLSRIVSLVLIIAILTSVMSACSFFTPDVNPDNNQSGGNENGGNENPGNENNGN